MCAIVRLLSVLNLIFLVLDLESDEAVLELWVWIGQAVPVISLSNWHKLPVVFKHIFRFLEYFFLGLLLTKVDLKVRLIEQMMSGLFCLTLEDLICSLLSQEIEKVQLIIHLE